MGESEDTPVVERLRPPTVTIAIVTNTAASAISNISLLLHQGSHMFAEVAKILGISTELTLGVPSSKYQVQRAASMPSVEHSSVRIR